MLITSPNHSRASPTFGGSASRINLDTLLFYMHVFECRHSMNTCCNHNPLDIDLRLSQSDAVVECWFVEWCVQSQLLLSEQTR